MSQFCRPRQAYLAWALSLQAVGRLNVMLKPVSFTI
jgi:hypothetical protein